MSMLRFHKAGDNFDVAPSCRYTINFSPALTTSKKTLMFDPLVMRGVEYFILPAFTVDTVFVVTRHY